MIEKLRLYKFDGDYIEFDLGKKTDMGTIDSIVQMPSGWYKVTYSTGKYGTFYGFNGTSILYSAPIG